MSALVKAGRVSRTVLKPEAGFRAELPGLDLATLIQMTCARRERAVVRVASYGEEGFLYSAEGRLMHATVGPLSGEEAVMRMLSWESGEFSICELPFPLHPTIETSTEGLLLRAAQRVDEAALDRETDSVLREEFEVSLAEQLEGLDEEERTLARDGERELEVEVDADAGLTENEPTALQPSFRPYAPLPSFRAPPSGEVQFQPEQAPPLRPSVAPPPPPPGWPFAQVAGDIAVAPHIVPTPAAQHMVAPAQVPPAVPQLAAPPPAVPQPAAPVPAPRPTSRVLSLPPPKPVEASPVLANFLQARQPEDAAPVRREPRLEITPPAPRRSEPPRLEPSRRSQPPAQPEGELPPVSLGAMAAPQRKSSVPPRAPEPPASTVTRRSPPSVELPRPIDRVRSSRPPAEPVRSSRPPAERSSLPPGERRMPPPPPANARRPFVAGEPLAVSSLIASVRIDARGEVVGAFGSDDQLPQLVAYVSRVASLVQAAFALDPFDALHAELSGKRVLIFQDQGELVGLVMKPSGAAQELRQRFGV